MSISVTAKTRTLTNGTANDATPVEANFVELYNNDTTLVNQLNAVTDSTFAFTGSKSFTTATVSTTLNVTGYLDLTRANDTSAPVGGIWHNSTSDLIKLYSNNVIRPVAFVGGFNAQTGTTYTVLSTDRHTIVTFNNASSVAVTLPQANSTGFTDGFIFQAKNIGAGTVTITPTTSTIDGAATITLTTGQSVTIASNNTNYFSLGGKIYTPLVVHYREVQSSGTNGGTFTAGSPVTRVLNTEVVDDTGSASVSSNQISLPAGTYLVDGSAPAHGCNGHIAWLQNVTDASLLVMGGSAYATGSVANRSPISGKFTIAAGKLLEVQHQCEATRNTDGLGFRANISGFSEVYTDIRFVKVA